MVDKKVDKKKRKHENFDHFTIFRRESMRNLEKIYENFQNWSVHAKPNLWYLANYYLPEWHILYLRKLVKPQIVQPSLWNISKGVYITSTSVLIFAKDSIAAPAASAPAAPSPSGYSCNPLGFCCSISAHCPSCQCHTMLTRMHRIMFNLPAHDAWYCNAYCWRQDLPNPLASNKRKL